MNIKINKRYKDIFDLYVHRGEPTPFTIGTIVVFGLCFLILIVATFLQLNFSHPWFEYIQGTGFAFKLEKVAYTPQIPAILFIIYILGRNYSILLFITYLIVGFFVWPIFPFGGGLDYAQNYLFGYFLGFIVAIFVVDILLKKSFGWKNRLLASAAAVFSIHLTGFLYCFFLAIFKVIDFGLIIPIVKALSTDRILYDTVFGLIIFMVIPYIKNVFWVCMKPKADEEKRSKRLRHRKQNS